MTDLRLFAKTVSIEFVIDVDPYISPVERFCLLFLYGYFVAFAVAILMGWH